MQSALRRWSSFMLVTFLPACVSASPPPYEAVDLSTLAAPDDVGTVLVAESPAVAFWEDPGQPRDFMGGSRVKPRDQHSLRATEGLAGALIDAGYVVLNASELRAALHDLARGDVDRAALSELHTIARQDLEPGIDRCLAFDATSTLARRPVGGADMDPLSIDSPFSVPRGPVTCMDELAAWLWERHVAAIDPAWVVETAIRADKIHSSERSMLGGWSSKLKERTQARAWRPRGDTELVATAIGINHPAAPLRALRGLGATRPRKVPRSMPERPSKTHPALSEGHADPVKITWRSATRRSGWFVRMKGDELSLVEGCRDAIPPIRFAPKRATVAQALNRLWPSAKGTRLAKGRCTLRAVRTVLGPAAVRFLMRCDARDKEVVIRAVAPVVDGEVDVTPVVRKVANRLLSQTCVDAFYAAERQAKEEERRQAEAARPAAKPTEALSELATVHEVAGRPLPAAYAMTPAVAAVLQHYLAKLGAVTSTSDAETTCAGLSAAKEAADVVSDHVSDVHTAQGWAMFEDPMATQADEAAEVFTAALPGITVHRGEALYALANYRELSGRDLPPPFKAALADPLLFGDETGRPPHQVLMTDIQICTSVATLSELLPASADVWRELPTCLRALIADDVQSSLDTASRGCFCDDEATARRVAPALLERLQPFDDLKQWNGKVRSVAVRAAIDDEASHFDGRCDF